MVFFTGVNKCTLQIVIVFFSLHTFTNTIKQSRAACYLTCLVRRIRRFVVRLIKFAPSKKTATHREACCFCCDCTYVSPLPNTALTACTLSFSPSSSSIQRGYPWAASGPSGGFVHWINLWFLVSHLQFLTWRHLLSVFIKLKADKTKRKLYYYCFQTTLRDRPHQTLINNLQRNVNT